MIITHPRTLKEVEINDLKVVFHKLPNKIGRKQRTKCVEFLIIGETSEWIDWSLYKEFKLVNKGIKI